MLHPVTETGVVMRDRRLQTAVAERRKNTRHPRPLVAALQERKNISFRDLGGRFFVLRFYFLVVHFPLYPPALFGVRFDRFCG